MDIKDVSKEYQLHQSDDEGDNKECNPNIIQYHVAKIRLSEDKSKRKKNFSLFCRAKVSYLKVRLSEDKAKEKAIT